MCSSQKDLFNLSSARRFSKSPTVLFTEAYEVVRLRPPPGTLATEDGYPNNLVCWSCSARIPDVLVKVESKQKVIKRVVQVPLACVKGCLYNLHGVFCSLPCGQRYVQHSSDYPESIRRSVPRNIAKMRFQILSHCNPELASIMCFYDLFVRSAPNPLILDIFGGFACRQLYNSMILECKRISPRPITIRKLCGKDPLGGDYEALPSEMRERIKQDTNYERILTVPILPGIQRLPSVSSLRCYVDIPLFHEDEDIFGSTGCADARPAQHVVIHKSAPLPASVASASTSSSTTPINTHNNKNKKKRKSVSFMLYKQRCEIRERFKQYTPPSNYDFSDKGLRKTSRLSSRISIPKTGSSSSSSSNSMSIGDGKQHNSTYDDNNTNDATRPRKMRRSSATAHRRVEVGVPCLHKKGRTHAKNNLERRNITAGTISAGLNSAGNETYNKKSKQRPLSDFF